MSINETENKATIPTTITIFPNNNNTKAILVGFSNFKQNPKKFSFYIHFATIENYLYSEAVTFNILVDDEKLKAKCSLQDRELISNAKYYCDVPTNSTDIKQISVEPDFHFDYQDNVTFVGITPFANMFKDNIQKVDDSYDYISGSNIYVIEHSKRIKYNKNNFNISGIMFNLNADFTSKNFDLLIYLISGNRTQINVQCSFADINKVNKDYY